MYVWNKFIYTVFGTNFIDMTVYCKSVNKWTQGELNDKYIKYL